MHVRRGSVEESVKKKEYRDLLDSVKNKFTNDALAFCENCISGNGLVVKIFGKNKPKQPEYVNCFWFRTICFITFQEKCCFSKDAGQPKALAEIITFLQVFFMFYNIIPIAKYSTAVLFCILGNFYHEIFRKKFFSRLFWPSFSEITCLEKGLGVELWIKNLLTNCIFWFFWD